MKKCPVCKLNFINAGLNNHIINKAKAETYNQMKELLKNIKYERTKSFLMMSILKKMPHFAFIKRNMKTKTYFNFK